LVTWRLPEAHRQVLTVISDIPDPGAGEFGCHEWYDEHEIGRWPHSLTLPDRASQAKSAQDIVATEPIWDRSELSHEELTARTIAAGTASTMFTR
jgi:hypothetical protein